MPARFPSGPFPAERLPLGPAPGPALALGALNSSLGWLGWPGSG